ncbi:hypothetical protein L596_012567 [Steinernema carpocapsae]|nr:hypothetical protein L596_012567 [Steinernema carpocapsae]
MLMIPNVIEILTQSKPDACHQSPMDSDLSPYMLPDECHNLLNFMNILVPSIAILLTVLLDTYAMWKLGHFVKIRKNYGMPLHIKNRNREKRLVRMIMVQAITSILTYISLCFAALIRNEFLQFLASSFLWGMVQSIDG